MVVLSKSILFIYTRAVGEIDSSTLVLVDCNSSCRAGTHFGWLCSSVHGSGRVCLGFSDSRSKPPDVGSRKPALMLRSLRLALFELQWLYHPLEGARFIAWRHGSAPRSTSKGLVLHSSGRWDVGQIPNCSAILFFLLLPADEYSSLLYCSTLSHILYWDEYPRHFLCVHFLFIFHNIIDSIRESGVFFGS